IYHPLEVAHIVASEIGLGTTAIVCALLHDVVEDTDYRIEDMTRVFGEKVGRIIDGLTKIKGIFDQTTESIQAENFKKMLLTLSDDVRVILIKLADRLHNMRTLDSMPPGKQLKIASETTYLYAPLAHRLGLFAIKSELEDLALKYTEPEIFATIRRKLEESEAQRQEFIEEFIHPIRKALQEKGLVYEIMGRTKSVYSIWQKMKKKEIPFEEVYDLFAVRIVIDTPPDQEKVDCWRVYSIITDFYTPNKDRLRDWVSLPKANGYEALHTTVMSHTGKWVEVQIRTQRMDEIAERGYAAHWKYKGSSGDTALDDWLNRIRELLKGESEEDALDFLSEFKLNLFTDEIYVFTPKGELKTLPGGATALDFAYHIHSQIGSASIGAKVNYKLVPLSHPLRTGDQVEIITSRKQEPHEEWLKFVVTARARANIKNALKEERRRHFTEGRARLEKLFAQLEVEDSKLNIYTFQLYTGRRSLIDLYYDLAKDNIGLKEARECFSQNEKTNWFRRISRPFARRQGVSKSLSEVIRTKLEDKPTDVVIEGGIDASVYEISSCCYPIPGDDVIGVVDYNGPTQLHRSGCPEAIQLMSKYGNRIVKAKWTNNEPVAFLTGIKVTGIDKPGLIIDITRIITEQHSLNIRAFNMSSKGEVMEGTITLLVFNTLQLQEILQSIQQIQGIRRAARLAPGDLSPS
ncbi:MAG TPA: RelA/SpoT family protein, partial [Bacteroidales bacterium]|nr:RelA/SpoT family protein [Bacteroidales bacterium]